MPKTTAENITELTPRLSAYLPELEVPSQAECHPGALTVEHCAKRHMLHLLEQGFNLIDTSRPKTRVVIVIDETDLDNPVLYSVAVNTGIAFETQITAARYLGTEPPPKPAPGEWEMTHKLDATYTDTNEDK